MGICIWTHLFIFCIERKDLNKGVSAGARTGGQMLRVLSQHRGKHPRIRASHSTARVARADGRAPTRTEILNSKVVSQKVEMKTRRGVGEGWTPKAG